MEELECSQDFPHYNPMGAICCHGNQSSDLARNLMQPIPHPNDALDEIWLWSASWSQRYSCLKVWTDARTDGRSYRRDVLRFLMVLTHCKLVRLTPQAHFNPITPCCTNPNLTWLNTAVQIANLIMYHRHVRKDGRRLDSHPISSPRAFGSGELKISGISGIPKKYLKF